MESYPDPDADLFVRALERMSRRPTFEELFNDPGQAADVLREMTARRDVLGGISSIVLDNSTVEHALRYFSDASLDNPRALLPTRPRLMLLAVADFINAVILYENVLTGPESGQHKYGDPLLQQTKNVARPVTERLSWTETFAVLSLAKATAAEAVRARGTVDEVADLLGTPLREEEVFNLLSAINPISALESAGGPSGVVDANGPQAVVDDDDFDRRALSIDALAGSRRVITAIDRADGEGYWTKRESAVDCDPERRPELFAAHLIYRMHVYLYLADLLGCPYSADALRSRLLQSQPYRGFAERVTTLAGKAENTQDQKINELLGFEAFKVTIPLVLKNILSRASKPSEVLEITLETRDSRPARRFREYCARVDAAIAGGKRDDVARACAELSAYGVRLESELPESRSTQDQAVQAAKEVVSVGSPLLGALIPGLTLAAGQVGTRLRRRKFAFVEQLTRTPRNLNEVEREFAGLWTHH